MKISHKKTPTDVFVSELKFPTKFNKKSKSIKLKLPSKLPICLRKKYYLNKIHTINDILNTTSNINSNENSFEINNSIYKQDSLLNKIRDMKVKNNMTINKLKLKEKKELLKVYIGKKDNSQSYANITEFLAKMVKIQKSKEEKLENIQLSPLHRRKEIYEEKCDYKYPYYLKKNIENRKKKYSLHLNNNTSNTNFGAIIPINLPISSKKNIAKLPNYFRQNLSNDNKDIKILNEQINLKLTTENTENELENKVKEFSSFSKTTNNININKLNSNNNSFESNNDFILNELKIKNNEKENCLQEKYFKIKYIENNKDFISDELEINNNEKNNYLQKKYLKNEIKYENKDKNKLNLSVNDKYKYKYRDQPFFSKYSLSKFKLKEIVNTNILFEDQKKTETTNDIKCCPWESINTFEFEDNEFI